jgi:hypothetical protein
VNEAAPTRGALLPPARPGGYVAERSDGGPNGLSSAAIETAASVDELARAEVPATPAEYKMPERGPHDEPLGVTEIHSLQKLGHALRVTPGEFKLMVMQGHVHARAMGDRAMTMDEMRLADARVIADLERAHGEDKAGTIAAQAAAAIRAAKARDANLGRVVQEMALQSRPMVELLAKIGRRLGRY